MPKVLIAGGGIGGLVTALTMHQIGVSCTVFETVRELRPKGVGLNLQPNAVRELYDLGIAGATLNSVGVPLQEWSLVARSGQVLVSEPRGLTAGYRWPQFSVDRGLLHMLLYHLVLRRMGAGTVVLGARVTGYRQSARQVTVILADGREETGDVLIGADGIHSVIRAQMYPDQPPPNRGNAVLWRGVTRARPIRGPYSFVGMGEGDKRIVLFPISHPGSDGLARINWIGVRTVADQAAPQSDSWIRPAPPESFAPLFKDWVLDWIDVPGMMRAADAAFETPLLDRDPVPTWRDGRVALLGDAAHPMFPAGSNVISQAIIDARVLGAAMVEHGVTTRALHQYDDQLCGPVAALVRRNRGEGPFELLRLVEARCGGDMDSIDTLFPKAEREEFMARYKIASGFAREVLNASPSLIAPGAQVAPRRRPPSPLVAQ